MGYDNFEGAVTYNPKTKEYVAGKHKDMTISYYPILARIKERVGMKQDVDYNTGGLIDQFDIIDESTHRLNQILSDHEAATINNYQQDEYFKKNSELKNLILMKLYNQTMEKQHVCLPLDHMYSTVNTDELEFTIQFMHNFATMINVPPTIKFSMGGYLERHHTSIKTFFNMFEQNPQQPKDLFNPRNRKIRARDGLAKLKYHYDKSASGKDRFSALKRPTSTDKLISIPSTANYDIVHPRNKVTKEIMDLCTAFYEEYGHNLTHFAMHPKVAFLIACDTWNIPSFSDKISEYRTSEAIRKFPGIPNITAVISNSIPKNVIYAIVKHSDTNVSAMIKAEGPKILETVTDFESGFIAIKDYCQYKCVHDDITNPNLRFGVIIDIAYT